MTSAAAEGVSTIGALRDEAVVELERAGIVDPRRDAELLLAHVLGVGHGRLMALAAMDAGVGEAHAARFHDHVIRRASREPLQHITGEAYFRTLTLAVGPGVFVPRPETEVLAGMAVDALAAVPSPEPLAVDLGTGSGAIALSLAVEVPHARVIGVENSVEAFIWARRNAGAIAPHNARIVFADLASALPDLDGTVDVLVSNPPYIPDAAVPRDAEVRLYDPPAALYGGADGLDAVRDLSRTAMRLLRPGAPLLIEHADVQGPDVRALFERDGWRATATYRDLAGRDRVTTALRP